MLDLRLVRTFLAVAAGPSFRKAAEHLHLAPSTVTTQIKALEEELGVRLFDRVGRNALLTDQGRRFIDLGRRLVDMEGQARRALGQETEDTEELSVRISETLAIFCLERALTGFRRRFPETRLVLSTASRGGLAHDLRQGAVELALILAEPWAGDGLEMECLSREPLVVIAPPDSPLAGTGLAGTRDLAAGPLLLTPHVWSARRLLERALARTHADLAGMVECSSVEIVKRLVMAGQGLSVVPAFAVREEVARGGLITLDWEGGPLEATVLMVRHARRSPSPAATALMDALRDFFLEREAQRS